MKRFALVLGILAALAPVAAFADSVTMVIPDVPDSSYGSFTAETGGYADAVSSSPGDTYLTVFADVTFSNGGATDAFYDEFAVSASGPYTITITNDPADISLTDAGYFISDSYIPLDQLNDNVTPPSGFTPFPGLNDSDLGAGDSISGTITPLPSAAGLGLVTLGAMGVIGFSRKKLRNA